MSVDKKRSVAGRWEDQSDYVPDRRGRAVVVPPVFFDDWIDCDCNVDAVEWAAIDGGRKVRASVTDRDRADLLSRARHYAEGPDYDFGLRSSARATVRALTEDVTG